jgi:hypothetical protein
VRVRVIRPQGDRRFGSSDRFGIAAGSMIDHSDVAVRLFARRVESESSLVRVEREVEFVYLERGDAKDQVGVSLASAHRVDAIASRKRPLRR